MSIPTSSTSTNGSEIAIIGLAGRFPGAKNIDEFWNNLQNGRESISFFSDEELLEAGIDEELLSSQNYVKAHGVLEDAELFDAAFFGFNPREAEITDPQHRVFLECASEALENAGYKSGIEKCPVGVFAGAGLNSYLLNLYSNLKAISLDEQQLTIGCDKDFLSTRTSYKLNLTGPSYTVQTACSTSLVAVHLACQSLLNGECDIALAGGVAISAERKAGYLYTEGGIASPDGHCRAFDANAQGAVGGEGVGIVVLKRLEDALSDRDTIHAVIKGSAINNDGSFKVSYTAPRIDTQAKAIRTAQLVAEVEPETISYIETHGTGTALGDPIEIAALTQVFRLSTQKKGFCAIGSVKTNIGHLDIAAGVTGLIKTVLALKHKQIPPSLHFTCPNPEIDFANSPFYVNTELAEWQSNGTPRRAGVSSFGIGGTNAHVVLEEAPITKASSPSEPWQLLTLSAKTSSALETATRNLANYFQEHPDLNLADTAYTLQVGRKAFDYRRTVVCRDVQDAVNALQDPKRVFMNTQKIQQRPVAFMFSGLGTHYLDMALEFYQTEPIFSSCVDQCCEILKPLLGLDLRDVLYPQRNTNNGSKQKQDTPSTGLDLRKMLGRGQEQTDAETLQATSLLNQTVFTQPAIFVVEYALAQLWIFWGIRPTAMIGYSIGEYVAATLAEVLSLKDALTLVARRAQMIEELPEGAMLAVPLSEEEIQPLLNEDISLSAINGSSLCVIAGAKDAVAAWEQKLGEQNLIGKRLQTSHAFHSLMMEAIAPAFGDLLKTFNLKPPKTPYISNVTGTWITAEQATDPNYWVKHLCQAVRFAEGVQNLWQKDNPILLEVGSGQGLISFASQCLESEDRAKLVMLPTLRHSYEQQSDVAFLMNTLGRLWLTGVEVDWSSFYAKEQRTRIPLPTYPFERQRYWIDANPNANLTTQAQQKLHKKPNIADWFYIPSWKRSPQLASKSSQELCYLVFIDTLGLGSQVAEQLKSQGHDVVTVGITEQFTKLGDGAYAINPQNRSDYDTLLQEISTLGLNSKAIAKGGGWHFAHFWSVTANDTLPSTESSHQFFEDTQNLGFWSLLFLAQALGRRNISDTLKLTVVTSNIYDVTGEDNLCPEKSTLLGASKVIPLEYAKINCSTIDIVIPSCQKPPAPKLLDFLVTEITSQTTDDIVAYRGHHRWVQTFEPVRLDQDIASKSKVKEGGVYLITGGLGGIGLVLAENLAQTADTKLILLARKGLPERSQWQQWLENHDSQNSISRKIEKVLAIEKLGATVQIYTADVANLEQMQTVVTQVCEQFGSINGAIHAAGIAPGGIIQLKTKEMANSVLAAKVRGTLVLEKVLQNSHLDFFVLCSSQTSVLGHFGQLDYCAANTFLDSYAQYSACKSNQQTISISWGPWQVGMEVETVQRDEIKLMVEEANLKFGIKPEEGIDAFHRALASNLPHLVVSTQDFLTLIEQSKSFQVEEELSALEEKLVSANITIPNHPRPDLDNDYVAPHNEVEESLAKIWQQRLGIDKVGVNDNFFELGGDSVLAIQVIAKANQLGFKLTAQQMFEHPTIAELATAASSQGIKPAQSSLRVGEVYLTPIQHRFFAQNQPDVIHSLSQSILLELKQNCDRLSLEQAVRYIIQYHDVFRLRFNQTESGWQQIEANTNVDLIEYEYVDLTLLPETEQEQALEAKIADIQSCFNLSQGTLVKVALVELRSPKNSYLVIAIHPLLVDTISWQILLEDLQTAYRQLSQSKAINLPEKTASFSQWTQGIQNYAENQEMIREQEYWLAKAQKPFHKLPVDYLDRENTTATFDSVSVSLDKTQTQVLLNNVNKAYNTQINDVLLTALVQAFAKWTGESQLWVDVEDNSREKIFKNLSDISLNRTIGLFTTCFPAHLDITEASDEGSALVAVKDYLRSIPNRGVGYDLLRYISSNQEIKSKLKSFPQPQVNFKYLGNFDLLISQPSLFNLTQQYLQMNQISNAKRFHLLEINGAIFKEQLHLNWIYSTKFHRRETIKILASNHINAVQTIIAHCQSFEGQKFTPSDFPRANLSKQNLDKLLAKITQVNEERA
ncbi:MAG: SDR family oxidoreductase [Cyanomargarita calcarea GSE-NOS-MK-12-04C]|uniref:Phenolphthiocerol/phthiocerol polyketide synthase subunit E n=1 Tax=Cyanomargarita calcarea GSE-NOS-MK-12-04C TaxID=2839659 RepID=A0A951QIM7_9CYAN|nr:SDR family oxidoreductase [Cyanomargarita calcarea GSE-NOS-MK-12-04C]